MQFRKRWYVLGVIVLAGCIQAPRGYKLQPASKAELVQAYSQLTIYSCEVDTFLNQANIKDGAVVGWEGAYRAHIAIVKGCQEASYKLITAFLKARTIPATCDAYCVPSWPTSAYYGLSNHSFIVHTARILTVMHEYEARWGNQWSAEETELTASLNYTWKLGKMPYNMQSEVAMALNDFDAGVAILQEIVTNTPLLGNYQPWYYCPDGYIEDISHGAIELKLIRWLYDNQQIDLDSVRGLLSAYFDLGIRTNAGYVNGTGASKWDIHVLCQLQIEAFSLDKRVLKRCL